MDNSAEGRSADGSTIPRRGAISLRGGVKTRGGRLPPLRMREAVSQPNAKKAVAPRIPVRRIKKEPEDFGEAVVKRESCSERGGRAPRGGRGGQRGRGRREYMQLEGSTFCEGPAAAAAARKKDFRYAAERERMPREAGVARVKTKKEIEDETERFKALLSTYGVDEDLLEDENKILPVRLPFPRTNVKKEIKEEPDADIKPIIKTEVIENELSEEKKDSLEGKFFTRIKMEDFKGQLKNNEIINHLEKSTETGMLILIQLPNSLPFNESSVSKEEENPGTLKKDGSNKPKRTEKEKEETKTESACCGLDRMQEGYVGKLQILKRGTMRLILGRISLSFEPGSRPAFCQELLSARCQEGEAEEEGSGDLTCLGMVRDRFVCFPVLEQLICGEEVELCDRSSVEGLGLL